MKIGFVGAGKAGSTLGKYMVEHQACVSGYYSRSRASAIEAAEFTHTSYFETLEEVLEESDALFLTVPDGAIENVWKSLQQYPLTGKLICHCSGAMNSAVFSGISQMGAFGYSIHPLFAIHSRLQSYREFSQAYITMEGSIEYLEFWKKFFSDMGNPVRIIDPEQKVLYHGAAVTASNLVVGLFETAARMLMRCGFDRESGEKALLPLFLNNCRNIADSGVEGALTGPAERADEQTIRRHLAVLSEEEKEIYLPLTKAAAEIAQRKHPDRDYKELFALIIEMQEKGWV